MAFQTLLSCKLHAFYNTLVIEIFLSIQILQNTATSWENYKPPFYVQMFLIFKHVLNGNHRRAIQVKKTQV